MRVFLDTNVLVAAFATRGFCEDVLRITLAEHELVVGETVLTELERILVHKLHVPVTQAKTVSTFLRSQADVIKPGMRASASLKLWQVLGGCLLKTFGQPDFNDGLASYAQSTGFLIQ